MRRHWIHCSKLRGPGMTFKPNRKFSQTGAPNDFESFFKVGISPDYILIRQDFPVGNILPGEFGWLIREMFRRNDEAINGKE